MSVPGGSRIVTPPVLSVQVVDAMDVMIARNTARQAASLLGFSSASRAQIAAAVAVLADTIVGSESPQTIHLNGLRNGAQSGLQVSCTAPWLAGANPDDALVALRSKIGDMMDEVAVEPGTPPKISMILWLSAARTTQEIGVV
jgi:hypothetical protein